MASGSIYIYIGVVVPKEVKNEGNLVNLIFPFPIYWHPTPFLYPSAASPIGRALHSALVLGTEAARRPDLPFLYQHHRQEGGSRIGFSIFIYICVLPCPLP